MDSTLASVIQTPSADIAAPDINTGPSPQASSELSSAVQSPVDLPRFQRTFAGTLKGMLMGLAMGGVPGAIGGAANPEGVAREARARATAEAANVTFANARAAHEVAMASMADAEYKALPEKLQQESDARGLANLNSAEQAGYLPVATVNEDAPDPMTALNSVKQQFGAIPSGMLYIHSGNGMTVMRLSNPTAALPAVNEVRRAMGMPELDSGTFAALGKAQMEQMAKDAVSFTDPRDPQTGQITQSSLNIANMRLETLKSQPEFNGKDALVKQLQATVDHQKAVLDSGAKQAAVRTGEAEGAQAQAAQPGQTAAKVAETKALAGPEAAAAGAKAEAVAKGTAKGQMEAMGNAKDAQGNWNPASLPVMLVEGNADPSQIKNARQGMTAQQVEQLASQYSMEKYGKPFDMAQAQSDFKYATNPTTQNTLKYLNALTGSDNKSGNLGQLVQQSNQITRTQFPALNNAAAWTRIEAGDPAMAAYHATVTEVADQVAKILQGGGSGTSDAKMRQAQELFQTGFNKDQITSVAETLRGLLANRKTELIGGNRYLQKQYGATTQPQGQPVYVGGKIAGYTTDGKTMVPVQ